MTLKSIQNIYAELQDTLEARGEGERVDKVAPDTLAFLVSFTYHGINFCPVN